MLARRVLVLLAVLMGLSALAAGVAPREPAPREGAAPSPRVSAAPPERPVERTVDAGAAAPARVEARVGQIVVLEVRSDELDSVSLGELGQIEPVESDSPARFELLAEEAGSYPIELLEAGRQIGTLEIRDSG